MRPRLTVDLTLKQKAFLDTFPHGWRQQIFSVLIEMLMDLHERGGRTALGAVAAKAFKLEDYFEAE